MSGIRQEIRRFLVDGAWLGREVILEDSESLLERGVIDSLAITELVVFVERRYRVRISDEDVVSENFDSITSIAELIGRRQAEGRQHVRGKVKEKRA